MNYQQFKEQLLSKMSEILKGMQRGLKLKETHLVTIGRERDAVSVSGFPSNISPVLYVDEQYEKYQNGCEISRLGLEAVMFLISQNGDEICLNDWPSILYNKQKMSQSVIPVLINTYANKHLLETVPHREVLDLSIVYRAILEGNHLATIQITNDLMDLIGMAEEELYQAAYANLRKKFKTEVSDLCNILHEALGNNVPADYLPMKVLRNQLQIYGAITMLDSSALQEVANQYQDDVIVLPSSVHESIAVPAKGVSACEMNQLVCEVNSTQVLPEEVLADHAYLYSRKENSLCNLKTMEILVLSKL